MISIFAGCLANHDREMKYSHDIQSRPDNILPLGLMVKRDLDDP